MATAFQTQLAETPVRLEEHRCVLHFIPALLPLFPPAILSA